MRGNIVHVPFSHHSMTCLLLSHLLLFLQCRWLIAYTANNMDPDAQSDQGFVCFHENTMFLQCRWKPILQTIWTQMSSLIRALFASMKKQCSYNVGGSLYCKQYGPRWAVWSGFVCFHENTMFLQCRWKPILQTIWTQMSSLIRALFASMKIQCSYNVGGSLYCKQYGPRCAVWSGLMFVCFHENT